MIGFGDSGQKLSVTGTFGSRRLAACSVQNMHCWRRERWRCGDTRRDSFFPLSSSYC